MSGFDRVAGIYHALEYAAFGRTLQRSRVAHLDRLRDCSDVLILGDGDGRFLQALMQAMPTVRVHSVDASSKMLALAASRLGDDDRARVTLERADVRHWDTGDRSYDAIVTLFFLDCFLERKVEDLVARLTPRLRPGGLWFFADFAIPSAGLARLHALVVVKSLYLFFKWRAGLEAQKLPPSEAILQRAGLTCVAAREFRAGILRSAVYEQEAAHFRSRP